MGKRECNASGWPGRCQTCRDVHGAVQTVPCLSTQRGSMPSWGFLHASASAPTLAQHALAWHAFESISLARLVYKGAAAHHALNAMV